MSFPQYTLIKLPFKEILKKNYAVTLTGQEEAGYLVTQESSLLLDQIERLRGYPTPQVRELVLVAAKKETAAEKVNQLKKLFRRGFTLNGIHYSRFGKSASQGKQGVTAFVCDTLFKELYQITQMDIPVSECVISKYEAQRSLVFSSCRIIPDYMPRIVIIGEYEKLLPGRLVKYVTEVEREYTDKETGETKVYKSREIRQGEKDIKLSPFDGCGCHEKEFTKQVQKAFGLDYSPIGAQVRMPFMKGYSVYVPFRQILKEWGVDSIRDIYGREHPVSDIDCIWNISMFKGHKLFLEKYGASAWDRYMETIHKYQYKLGISKYSHHRKNLSLKSRMNFQYLQCLDLWNPAYIAAWQSGGLCGYDSLNQENQGKIVSLARYTTSLFEKIIKGDKFYTCKFLGMTDSESYEPDSKYLEAVLTNDAMLKDPAVRQFLYRKLKKSIDQAKVGKIYGDGFYHTIVGDMVGYLQYAASMEPKGCLREQEFFCGTLKKGDCLSFRSPLIDPSEVNRVRLVDNEAARTWFSHFRDQDVVMINMYDLTLPRQGGADCDGDIVFLCTDPELVASKIEAPVIVDLEDKASAVPKKYTEDNLVEYELMTRDSRIGEITNAATSILNQYTEKEDLKSLFSEFTSLLRILQGKEIDYVKTGVRYPVPARIKSFTKQLPYFLLYHYPKKMEAYKKLCEQNKRAKDTRQRAPLTAYRSPSPMNELCDYICAWENKHVRWKNHPEDLPHIRSLLLNQDLDLSSRQVMRICRRYINSYADELRQLFNQMHTVREDDTLSLDAMAARYENNLKEELGLMEELIANYVIFVSYKSMSISKAFAWTCYGDWILTNLKKNSNSQTRFMIKKVPDQTQTSREYLGNYYEYREVPSHL